jgi:hypothetical protein
MHLDKFGVDLHSGIGLDHSAFTMQKSMVVTSVPDPDPPDPHVFGPPGSGSTSQRYRSGSFYHNAKIVRKTFIPTTLRLFLIFYLTKSNIQKKLCYKISFLLASWRSMTKITGSGSISQRHGSEDPDPDPPQNVMDPEHWLLLVRFEITNRLKRTSLPGFLSYPGWNTWWTTRFTVERAAPYRSWCASPWREGHETVGSGMASFSPCPPLTYRIFLVVLWRHLWLGRKLYDESLNLIGNLLQCTTSGEPGFDLPLWCWGPDLRKLRQGSKLQIAEINTGMPSQSFLKNTLKICFFFIQECSKLVCFLCKCGDGCLR